MRHYDRQTNKGEQYVADYPDCEKWINQCIRCQQRGLRPDTPSPERPEDIYAASMTEVREWSKFRTLRRHFEVLPLTDGLCDVCRGRS